MICITEKSLCVGCAACADACPRKCIDMIKDAEGFLYPEVDSTKCSDCGACDRACPMLQKQVAATPIEVVGCTSKDDSVLNSSSSGGMFTMLVDQYFKLHPDAHVYGASFKDDFSVSHTYIESVEEIFRIRESKYVQSNCVAIYQDIKRLLDEGKYVYFSGTPCQVAAVKTYLRKEYDNLFTQAILCHGVPSPELWKTFVDELRSLHTAPIKQIHFRDKENGWEKYKFSVVFEDGVKKFPDKTQKWYLDAFGADLSLRPSCYRCRFKYPNYLADITIGDFWNVKQYCPEAYNERGVSLAIITTAKGIELFEKIKENSFIKSTTAEQAIKSQKGIAVNISKPKKREAFFEDLKNQSPYKATCKHTKKSLHRIMRSKLAKIYRNLIYKFSK